MTPIAQVLARLLARLRQATVQPDPTVPPMDRPGDTHSRKVTARAMSAQRQWELAALCAENGLPHLAAEWVVAATSRDDIPRILPPEE